MDKEKFEKDMAVFSLRQIQDFLTFYKTLVRFEYSINDIENYLEHKKEELTAKEEPKRIPGLKCPDCGSRVQMLPVNDKPSTQTGDDSKTALICINRECMHTDYSTKSVSELLKELSKK